MRFLAARGYSVIAIGQEIEILANGTSRVLAPGYICEFRKNDSTSAEREQARKQLRWNAAAYVKDVAGRDLDPLDDQNMIWVFDTSTVPDRIRARVEESLQANNDFGRPDGYILAEEAVMQPPYPRYDEHRRIVGRRTLDHATTDIRNAWENVGFDLTSALDYERHQEDTNQGIIDFLESLRAPQEEEELIVA